MEGIGSLQVHRFFESQRRRHLFWSENSSIIIRLIWTALNALMASDSSQAFGQSSNQLEYDFTYNIKNLDLYGPTKDVGFNRRRHMDARVARWVVLINYKWLLFSRQRCQQPAFGIRLYFVIIVANKRNTGASDHHPFKLCFAAINIPVVADWCCTQSWHIFL